LRSHYRDFPLSEPGGAHFGVSVSPPSRLRSLIRPQAVFAVNGRAPFNPVPARLATGLLEWGLNWCIGRVAHQWLVVHAAVVAREGKAAVLPALPGSGKSTLCAALAFSGWRLFSDEFALIDPATAELIPAPRPVALKGQSIEVIAGRASDARFGPLLSDTDGRSARHLAPPALAVRNQHERARLAWVVVPKWEEGAPLTLEPVPKGRTLAHLADSSFNYNTVGAAGFECLARMVDGAQTAKLTYSNLDEALALFERMHREQLVFSHVEAGAAVRDVRG
jgi:HprK-related kinase A